ncbi:Guanine nucleotide exchange factor for Cdc42p [Tilletia horrida]|uniref:Guanine nucleotide exchange factor for Cdc42p n=1 Tax=Tilletia horrida TaxID=155126 RepID=A0AAN6GKS6_9BASI|nr:Guanine nucleotide exchange factor for Cdc42p [Tilletia horrida]KAK0545969.1 Guanine nucleotide exchange factor for Cdc42p [Tilletia horrida]
MLRPIRKQSLSGSVLSGVSDPNQFASAPPSPSPYIQHQHHPQSYFSSSAAGASTSSLGASTTMSSSSQPTSSTTATTSASATNPNNNNSSSFILNGVGPGGATLAHGAPQAASTIGNRPAIAGSSLYQACLNLQDRLWCVDGYGKHFIEGHAIEAAIAAKPPPPDSNSSSVDSSGLMTPTGLGMGGIPNIAGGSSGGGLGSNVSLDSTEPVSKLWATFRLGSPLCYLWNIYSIATDQPPDPSSGSHVVEINYDLAALRYNHRDCKKFAAYFVMHLGRDRLDDFKPDNIFRVTDLYLDDTNGFVKIVKTVSRFLDSFEKLGLLVPSQDPKAGIRHEAISAASGSLAMTVNELLNTERKYVQDLEAMQNYARALQKYNILPPDTIHKLFGNLNALVDVARRFLISVEENARRPPEDQHFGHAVMAMENDFAVYEPFCANYSLALDTINSETPNMLLLKDCPGSEDYYLTPNYELPSLLIKPVQRICKYPLLLEQIIKNTPDDAPHKEELLDGLHVVKRIAEKVNETQRMQENEQIVKELEVRVDDWKGHNIYTFGPLLLHEHFTVMKSDTEREYYVYLFERILLCCKDPPGLPVNPKDKKKKDKKPTAPVPGIAKKEKTPLQLKGRIFTENMTGAYPQTKIGSVLGVPGGQYSLQIWWRNEHDIETLGLKCKNEEQLNKWKTAVNRLIDEAAAKRKLSYSSTSSIAAAGGGANGMSPMMANNMAGAGANGRRLTNGSSSFPMTPLSDTSPFPFRSGGSLREDMDPGYAAAAALSRVPSGPSASSAMTPTQQIQAQAQAAAVAAGYGVSRFSQPAEQRDRKMSMSQDAAAAAAANRPRARTEDQDGATMAQWRSHSPAAGLPGNVPGGGRPPMPWNPASMNGMGPDGGMPMHPGGSGSTVSAHTIRKASSSRQLRPAVAPLQLNNGGMGSGMSTHSGHMVGGPHRAAAVQQRINTNEGMEFMDVATPSPTAESFGPGMYPGGPSSVAQRRAVIGGMDEGQNGSSTSLSRSGSESMAAYRNRSASNPQSYVPISHLNAPPLPRHSPPTSSTVGPNGNPPVSQAVKLIISHGDEKFTIVVLQSIGFGDLQDKVTKKLRLCSARKTFPETGVRIRYVDEDGDVVAMNTDDDVQMAFEAGRKTRQDVTLVVS